MRALGSAGIALRWGASLPTAESAKAESAEAESAKAESAEAESAKAESAKATEASCVPSEMVFDVQVLRGADEPSSNARGVSAAAPLLSRCEMPADCLLIACGHASLLTLHSHMHPHPHDPLPLHLRGDCLAHSLAPLPLHGVCSWETIASELTAQQLQLPLRCTAGCRFRVRPNGRGWPALATSNVSRDKSPNLTWTWLDSTRLETTQLDSTRLDSTRRDST